MQVLRLRRGGARPTCRRAHSNLGAWREFLALLFLGSVMVGTVLVMVDREFGEGDKR